MKKLSRIVLLAAGFTIAVLAARAFLRSTPSSVISQTGLAKGFAVVELFTSEGCSSCPPADQLVARIQQEEKDQPVYILAFHVDYWDRLGWKDAFSDHRYTQRQNKYASWLKLQSIYTPEIVVNGRDEFVGSQEKTLRSAILSGLGQTPTAEIEISDVRSAGGKVSWHYKVSSGVRNSSLIVAIVQRSATTEVKAGENGGRTLEHVQIVRNLSTISIGRDASGAGSVDLPQGSIGGRAELIGFVQDDTDGQILAATRSPIN